MLQIFLRIRTIYNYFTCCWPGYVLVTMHVVCVCVRGRQSVIKFLLNTYKGKQ